MQKVQFHGSGSEYFKIWIVNMLLTIVTLSLYYPWAKVRNNRYFYANTQVGEHNFEYHATGKQLFPGYLIALVLLITYVSLQQFSPVGSVIVLLVFFAIFPWIIWKSLMFNLKMSSYANVRFGFSGSLGESYFNFMLLLILFLVSFYASFLVPTLLTIPLSTYSVWLSGLAAFVSFLLFATLAIYMYAYKQKMNAEYLINNRHFGNGQFTTNLETKPLFLIALKTCLLGFGAIISALVIFSMFVSVAVGLEGLSDIEAISEDINVLFNGASSMAFVFVLVYVGMIGLGVVVAAYAKSRIRNYIYGQTSLDEGIAFQSELSARTLAWVQFSNLLLIVFTIGLASPWAKVRVARILVSSTLVDTSVDISHYITQQQKQHASLGDQIGDAFDVDVGVAL